MSMCCQNRMLRIVGSAAVSIASIGTAATASAQSTLEEITVTASKRESSMQSTPIAISAMTGAQLEESNIQNPQDLASFVPGLEIGNSTGNLQISLRGVSNDSFFLASDAAVAFHVDGVFRGRQTGGNSIFLDLERVEVLKGPQGTLYGRNATAGSINVITAKPTRQLEGYVEANGGNLNHVGGRAVVNVPVIEGKVAMRAAMLKEQRDGFFENGPQLKNNYSDMDDTAFRLHTLLTPTDRLSILLTADYQARDGVGDGTQILAGQDVSLDEVRNPYRIWLNTEGEREDDFYTFAAETEYAFDDLTLTYLGAYYDSSVEILSDYDRNDVQEFPIYVLVASKQQSHEIRLASSGERAVDWLLGAYYFDEDAERLSRIQVSAPLFSSSVQPNFGVRSKAAFGQASIRVTDPVRITAGLRYTKDEKSEEDSQAIRTLNGVSTVTFADYAAEWNSWDWTLGADWTVNDHLLYAKVSTGFKSGGFNDPRLVIEGMDEPDFKPEEIIAYQVGHKSRFAGNTLQVNSEAFYYDYSDLQITQLIGATSVTTNAANAKIKGVETEIVALPTDKLRLSISLGYVDAKFESFQSYDATTQTVVDLTNSTLPRSPKWSGAAAVQYDFALANQWYLVPRLSFMYRSATKLRIFEDRGATQGDWTRTDLSIGVKSPSGAFDTQLYVNNLEDDVVWTNAGINGAGVRTLSARPPMMYGARVRYSFGQ